MRVQSWFAVHATAAAFRSSYRPFEGIMSPTRKQLSEFGDPGNDIVSICVINGRVELRIGRPMPGRTRFALLLPHQARTVACALIAEAAAVEAVERTLVPGN